MGLWETVEEKRPNLSEGLAFGPSRKRHFSWEPPFPALHTSLSIFQPGSSYDLGTPLYLPTEWAWGRSKACA